MNRPTHLLKVFWLALHLCGVLPAPPPGTGLRRDGPVGQRACTEGQYQPKSSGMCCQECPAGEHPVSPCTSEGGRSVCQACPAGTFTAHSNHLHFCPSCTPCQKDQEAAQLCSPTTDSVCRCKAGSFCSPDQPCEACHRCRSCKSGETLVKNCTSDANSVCAKSGESPGTPTAGLWWILGFLLFVVAVAVAGVWVYKKKRHWLKFLPSPSPGHSQQDAAGQGSLECTQNARNMSVQISLLPSEDPRGDDSSGLGSSSSESSLTNQHPNPCTPPSPSSARNDDELLHPLNGVKSLKDCFEFFQEEVSCRSYKKFFRSLDLNDNAIDNASKDDIVYELLGVWLQKQGKGATLQHLLGKLRDLDQNQSADAIVKKAIAKGHYERRVTPHPPVDKSDE